MKFIKPRIEVIEQKPGLNGMFKQIEIAGRTCYKSEANITDDSAEKFVNRMIASNHTAMLEHGTLYLDVPIGSLGDDREYMWKNSIVQFFKKNKYSRVNKYRTLHRVDDNTMISIYHYAITTNYRVFIEQIPWDKLGNMRSTDLGDLGLEKDYVLSFACEPTKHHDKRITVKMYTDRGVSAEANRHRADSPAEQSTRYCNYSKDKFGNEITIALNADIDEEVSNQEYTALEASYGTNNDAVFKGLCQEIIDDKVSIWSVVKTWMFGNMAAEFSYMNLLKMGWTPQQARRVLPLDLHTELVHTAYEDDWQHFIDLRSIGTTGKPHPDMKLIGDMINDKINNK